ncbi:MAG TPA: beta-galactosidase [Candidatus Hydrogenedentes bacterium]|nr:beta-galactosidase [Candidatus Hydrogenedentota bacterium]
MFLLLPWTAWAGNEAAAEIPRPEHPRPQMVRSEWLNLNGEWEFAESDDDREDFSRPDAVYPDKIVVPFCRESNLSGLARRGFVKNVWYRRHFAVPSEWKSRRIRLHVGASDWKTRVWVNGQLVGEHVGGSAPFAFETGDVLDPRDNWVVIHAYDDARSGRQACGKQSQQPDSYGCVYTRTTGIWQTVWIEGVGDSFLEAISVVPGPGNKQVTLRAGVDGPSRGLVLEARVSANGKKVGRTQVPVAWGHTQATMRLSRVRRWTPADPFLYDMTLRLKRGNRIVDEVDTYFGVRTVTIDGAAILINGEAVFQRLVLDQGFYPDGIWTAPSDAALRKDIELSQAAGFNGARLHQKVFEPRFLYWADRLGYVVWGEFPNWGMNVNDPAVNGPVIDEWVEILERDRNHPAIVGWCPFNETPPSAGPLQRTIVDITRVIDPTRPVLESSGYHHGHPAPDLLDAHDYDQDPAAFNARWGGFIDEYARPFFVSEYGGIGWQIQGGWGYGAAPSDLEEFYRRYAGLTNALLDNRFMFGFCYTQLYDIEQEQNGVYTYEREPKFDVARLRGINARKAQYEIHPPLLMRTDSHE